MQRGLNSGLLQPLRVCGDGLPSSVESEPSFGSLHPLRVCGDGLPSSVESGPSFGSLHPSRHLWRGARPQPSFRTDGGSFDLFLFWQHLCGIIKQLLLCSVVLAFEDGFGGIPLRRLERRRLSMQRGLNSGLLHPLRVCGDGLPSSVEQAFVRLTIFSSASSCLRRLAALALRRGDIAA